jgi:D-alanyl-D-alanine carboxypeptidase
VPVTLPLPTSTIAAPAPVTSAPVAPGFASTVSQVTAAELGSSYRAGCPIGPDQLRSMRMSYWGFDDRAHTGTLIVNADLVDAVVTVFGRLYAARFPIRRMEPVDEYGSVDRASMAADNTSSFNCRFVAGSSRWSAHAYGQAIDIDTVENPYVDGANVQPPAGRAYLDRSDRRAGMAYVGGVLNSAFAALGWQWGGRWASPDYQHFSSTGR